ncbi:Twinfilin-1 [Podospora pseudopauciseta]|uniref:Twinfilin-1 n=1 Tax=Podospora pseudopauciseta TaxID=2093780 RepID=A0ABR0GZV7_9PEZI|nr:Twinfilin-1 [Podospora pseudopauciseta]
MQSGISASQELVSQFNEFLASESHFGLLVTIASEKLQPLQLLTSSPGAAFADNVNSLLKPHVKLNEALYVILRRYPSSPALVGVTYVPDTAPVRQKMLFASTERTLVRELGTEHFRETFFATSPDELTPAGFDKHDAHSAVEAPLTEEERSLGAVRKAEQEAGQGTGTREIHLSQNLATPIAENALDALRELGSGSGPSLVMLKINPQTESVELVPENSNPSSISELLQVISSTEPRFTFYRFIHTHNGEESSPLLFFYTCPASPGTKAIKFRMMYPLMKRAVLAAAEKEADLKPVKRFEVEEVDELSEATVLEELHPKVEVKKAFGRPKRPGR